MKPSKKNKNTYTIAFNSMIDMGLFAYCKQTPMPLITINGQKQETNTSKEFPNPYANEMAQRHIENTHKLGEKIATTIIEYLDKKTNKPVVQLYPSAFYIFEDYKKDYMSHLNHATRHDLQHEIKKRMTVLNNIKTK